MGRPIQHEHKLQSAIFKWTKSAIDAPHLFFSFDAAKKSSMNAWQREAARGVQPSTPDCALFVKGMRPIWAELKAPGNRPTERQIAMGDAIIRDTDGFWSWVDSVAKYALWLQAIGVPLVPNAVLQAEQYDGKVEGWVARAEAKAGKPPKSYRPRADKPTAARLRKMNAVRARVGF